MVLMLTSLFFVGTQVVKANGANSGTYAVAQNASASNDPVQHSPIYIDGNSNFTAANGVVSGSGTASDPYIIENWIINASGANGISIGNTTAFFVVRNCEAYNGSLGNYVGICMENVSNGAVDNCSFSSDSQGILLNRSLSNTVVNNTCFNDGYGIFLYISSSDTFANNTCYSNSNGICLYDASSDSLTNNACFNNNGDGIFFYYGSNNALTNNICSNNTGDGIYFDSFAGVQSENNTLTNNVCSGNTGDGIYFDFDSSSYNTLINNVCSNNTGDGIHLYAAYNDSLTNNICSNNKGNGISLVNSGNNLTGNICSNNAGDGIYIYCSSNENLTNNACSGDGDGIYLYSSSNDIFANSTCSFHYYGIFSDFGYDGNNNNAINGSDIYNNSYGIYFSAPNINSTEVHYCNICNNSNYGIYDAWLDPNYPMNATYCWWGSVSGPSGAGSGGGDAISGDVIYRPWLNESATSSSLTSVSFSPNSLFAGSPVNCTVTVSGSNPTGTITWSTNSSTGVFSSPQTGLTSGVSSTMYSDPSPGAVNITACYSGDSNNAASSGSFILNMNANQPSGVVNFTETGLPKGTVWFVQLGNNLTSTAKGFITFYNVANGTTWSADPAVYTGWGARYAASPPGGHVGASSSVESITISYQKQYYVTELSFTYGGGILHGSGWYNASANLTLSAKAYSGYNLGGWIGIGFGSYTGARNPATITLNGPIIELAYFTKQFFYLSMNTSGGGFAYPGSGWYQVGQTLFIAAFPKPGYAFSYWSGTGTGSYSGASYFFAITINGQITETAHFVKS